MKAQELIKVIKDNNLQRVLFDADEYFEDYSELTKEEATELGIKNYEVVDNRCDTSEFWSILHFKDYNVFIKLTGEYDSYGQYEHEYDDEVHEVFPKQITKTVYE